MKESQSHLRSQTIWYILWSAMLLLSAGNTLAPSPVLSGNVGFIISVVLAAAAGLQLLRGVGFLRYKEATLARVLLIVFCTAQLEHWVVAAGPAPRNRGFDFSAYYLAAKVGSETPAQSLYYLPLYADGRMNLNGPAPISSDWHAAALRYNVPFTAPFIYPPFFAVLVRPLAYLSFTSAYIVWKVLAVLFLFGAVLLSLSLGGLHINSKLALIMGVGLFSYYPFTDELNMGQNDSLILFLIAAGVWLLARDYKSLSAFSFAVATLIKLTPLIALPLLIIHRQWKWVAAYFAWISALLIFSVSQAGWAMHQQYWHGVLPRISCGAPVCQNSSVVAYVQELFLGHVPIASQAPLTIPPYACVFSRSIALAVYVLMVVRFYLKRQEGDFVHDLVIMALLSIAVSPISWWHYYVIGLLPFLYLWCTVQEKGNRTLLALFIAVGTNIVGYFLLLAENHIVQLTLAGIVPGLTIALVYLQIARKQEPPNSSHPVLDPTASRHFVPSS